MKLKLILKNINDYSDITYHKYYQSLNNYQKSKINKLKRIEDKKLSLLGMMLVAHELNINIKDIHYSKRKPYVKQNIYFSITHKYPYVGVIVSPYPVGIDLEILNRVKKCIQEYLNSSSSLEALINWTKKESIIKYGHLEPRRTQTIIINHKLIITICMKRD